MWNRAPFQRGSWCGCTGRACLKLPPGRCITSSANRSGPALAGRSFTPFLHTLLLSPTVVQWFSQWSLVRYERGEVKTTSRCRFPAPNSRETACLSWTESGPSEPRALPLKPDSPLAFMLATLTGRFHLNLAGCDTEGSRLDPAPTSVTDIHHVDFNGTK